MINNSKIDNISVVILTYNEERNISRVLNSCKSFSEIIILDSYSDDDTILISEKYTNVRIFFRKFDNHSEQWNYAISLSKNDFVLCLDADYVLSYVFTNNLKKMKLLNSLYYSRFEYLIFKKKLFRNIYPEKVVLFDKKKHSFNQDGHTQIIHDSGPRKYLKGKILHDDRKPLSRWLKAQEKYADLEVSKMKSIKVNTLQDSIRTKSMIAPILVFFYVLIVKLNILSGRRGIYYAYQRAYAEILLFLKLNEK